MSVDIDEKISSSSSLEDRISFRIAVLVCACILTFGSYYCYDIPGAMTVSLEDVCFFLFFIPLRILPNNHFIAI